MTEMIAVFHDAQPELPTLKVLQRAIMSLGSKNDCVPVCQYKLR